jgi:hypothetical protein
MISPWQEQSLRKLPQIASRFRHRQCRNHEQFFETGRTALSYLALPFCVCRLLPCSLSVTGRPICLALPSGAFRDAGGTLRIICSQSSTVSIAHIQFHQIAVQMLFLAMPVNALGAEFEDRQIAFHGVGVNYATNVLLLAVVDCFVVRKRWTVPGGEPTERQAKWLRSIYTRVRQ